MLTALRWVLPILFIALPAFSAPPPFLEFRCRGLFNANAPLEFPEGWPLTPDQARQIHDRLSPQDRQTMWLIAQLAEFVDSLPPVLLDELGLLVSFDLVVTFGPEKIPPDRLENAKRFYQFLAARNVLGPEKAVPPQLYELVRSMAEHYRGAPPTQPWRTDRLSPEPDLFVRQLNLLDQAQCAQGRLATLKEFYEAKASRLPPIGSFLQHSREALFYAVLYVLNSENLSPSPENVETLQTLFEKTAKGEAVPVPSRFKSSFDALQSLATDSKQTDLQKALFYSGLIDLTAKFYDSFATRSSEPTDQFETYYDWVYHLKDDMVTDQGWQPFLKSLVVEVLMKRPTLTGEEMKFIIRTNVEQMIRLKSAPLLKHFGLDKKPEQFH